MKINYCIFSASNFKKHVAQSHISTSYFQTPGGILRTLSTGSGIYEASFTDDHNFFPAQQLSKLHDSTAFSLILVGTEFQIKVWQHTLKINSNTTLYYQELAQAIGHPRSFRAVAQALAHNKIAYFIPCHRVINKNGMLGGYRWGFERKIELLHAEK